MSSPAASLAVTTVLLPGGMKGSSEILWPPQAWADVLLWKKEQPKLARLNTLNSITRNRPARVNIRGRAFWAGLQFYSVILPLLMMNPCVTPRLVSFYQQTNKGVDKVHLMAPVLASSTWRTWPERASVQKKQADMGAKLNPVQASDWMNFYINEHIRDLWETRGERSSLTGHLLSVLAKYSESRPLLLYAVFLKICPPLWSRPPSGCQSEKQCFASGKKKKLLRWLFSAIRIIDRASVHYSLRLSIPVFVNEEKPLSCYFVYVLSQPKRTRVLGTLDCDL